MTKVLSYDAIIIGAGQAGSLAVAFAEAGKQVALIEKAHVGGTCINVGCTPAKTLVASAQMAHLVKQSKDFGVQSSEVQLDWAQVRERKNRIVEDFRANYQQNLDNRANLHLIRGAARFVDKKRIEVLGDDDTKQVLTAEIIVIATGTQNAVPPVEGLDKVLWFDATSMMDIEAVPQHLVILGGGYIAVEFAQMFQRFGAQVSVIEMTDSLLPGEDADISAALQQILEEDGIKVLCNAEAQEVSQDSSGVTVQVLHSGQKREVRGSHLMVATGRKPNTAELNLAATGVATDDKGFVRVNERLETNVSGVYALGDVANSPQFNHVAYDDHRILRDNLLYNGQRTTHERLIAYTVFTDPQLGRVGMSEEEAQKQNISYRVAQLPMTEAARAVETGQTRGFWKVLIGDDDQILGGAFFSMEGGEIAGAIQIAMMGKLRYQVLCEAPFAHPTLVEALNNLFLRLPDNMKNTEGEISYAGTGR
jgi:pyruvate/2-oxoglutarate dehydrogenase complex dihydrolipoamide dehydrogenase (E3) component